jgi:hypothetical protein
VVLGVFSLLIISVRLLFQDQKNYHHPEVHFTTLALFLLISTYQGKQLVNIPIIRLVAEPIKSESDSVSRYEKEAKYDTVDA